MVPTAGYVKTAFLQFKISDGIQVELRRDQVQESQALPYVGSRAFVVAVNRSSPHFRIAPCSRLVGTFKGATTTYALDSWLDLNSWLSQWFDCALGEPSTPWNFRSPESNLLYFAVDTKPSDWWGIERVNEPVGDAELLPARMWISFNLDEGQTVEPEDRDEQPTGESSR